MATSRDPKFDDDDLMTPTEVAKRLSVGLGWVYRQVESGSLPCVQVGKYLRFHRRDIERWLAAQRRGA